MLRVTVRNLWLHKRRLISTLLAILLGVAFMSGTLVLTDTLDKAFDDIFRTASRGIDAEVRGPELFDSDFGGTVRGHVPADLVEEIAGVDGVRVVAGYIANEQVSVLDDEGDQLGSSQGPPTWVENWVDDPDLNAFHVTEGRAPEADDEVVINRTAAEDGELELGDSITILGPESREEFTLVGITTFGDDAGSAGGTTAVGATLATAQRLAAVDDEFDIIVAAADDGISEAELVERIAPVLPDDISVVTGEQAADEDAEALQSGFAFFRQILLVFAGIALFVGTFIIINTFSILVAQRTREMALLRAIGAARRQVLASVLVEALLVGLIAAVVGLGAGIALAAGVQALLDAIGVDLPTTSLSVRPNTILTALIVGVVVTVLSALSPAIKATRVKPLAALRDVAIDETGASRPRLALGVVLIALGLLSMSPAFGDDPSTDVVPGVGLGAFALLVGVIVIGPLLARPLSRGIGSFLPRLKGTTGKLARENAMRSPRRTASTSAALMIGVALVTFITVFGASATTSVEKEVARGFVGDLVAQSSSFSTFGVSRQFTADLREIEGVELVSAMQYGPARVTFPDGDTADPFIGALDPETFGEVFDVRMEEGQLTDLGPGGVLADRRVAEDRDLSIGDEITFTGSTGASAPFRIDAISDDLSMLGSDWILTSDDFLGLAPDALDAFMGIKLDDGADLEAVKAEMEEVADTYPNVAVQDRDEFVGALADQITGLLNVIYGLLLLSIIIALIGISNTLSLSIHERTRELGLLRAVGMTRAQVRSAIRWEALVVALMGTVLGLVLGLGLAYVMVQALASFGLQTFDLPLGGIVTVVLLGVLIAVLASFRPSRRAARLNILDAIATE